MITRKRVFFFFGLKFNTQLKRNGMQIGGESIENLLMNMVTGKKKFKKNSKGHICINDLFFIKFQIFHHWLASQERCKIKWQ